MSTPTVRLFLAGSPHGRPYGALAPVQLTLRDAALLAWLAIEGPTHRSHLAALLWPDSEADAARNSLRQRLFKLRKLLGSDVTSGTTLLALADHVEHDLQDADSVLGDGAHDYSEELSHWLDTQRAARHGHARRRLSELADRAEAERDLTSAIEHVQQLLAIDSLHEDAHARLIGLHYQCGDRTAALAAWDRCVALLRESLGTEPSAKLRGLKLTIERAPSPAAATRPALPIGMLRPPRFVGREHELLLARGGWQANQVVVVTGEAGMGKTRLLQELVGTTGSSAQTSARPGDAAVPYSAMSRLLGAVAKTVPRHLGDPGVTPTLPPGLPDSSSNALSPAAAAPQARAVRCVRDLLSAAVEDGLRAVVFDDLHFADSATLELLIALTHGGELGELRIGFAWRPFEGEPALRRLEEALLDQQRVTIVPLLPLDALQMRAFVDALGLDLDPEVAARLGRQLHRHAGGNPLFALETLRQAWTEQTLGSGELPRPVNVGRLIERRLARLSPGALRLARCAAIAGSDFTVKLAARVLGVPALDLADEWRELEEAQVLRETGFAHDLILESVLAAVPLAVARHLHADVAAYLYELGAPAARLAGHWDRAQRWGDAGQAYRQAAQQARSAGRRVEEASLLADAARCFLSASDANSHFETLLARADVLGQLDFTAEAEAAVAAVESAAVTEEQELRATLARIVHENSHNIFETVLSRGPDAIERARALDRMDLVLPLSMVVAEALADARRSAEALALLAPLRQWVDGQASEEQRFDYFMALGFVLDYGNRLAEALPAWEAARSVAERMARTDLVWQSLGNMAATQSKLGQVRLSAELYLQALQSARAHAEIPPGRLMQAQCTLAHRLRDLGRYAEAVRLLEEALAFFRDAKAPGPSMAMAVHRLAQAFQQLGQPARAQALLSRDLADLTPGLLMMHHVHRADLAQQLGNAVLAQREIRTALERISNPDDVYYRVGTMFAAGIVEPEEAESLATSLAAWASAHQRFGLALAGHVRAAGAALRQRAVLRALPHVEAALRLSAEYQPDSFYLPELWLVAGRVLMAADRTEEARHAVEEGCGWVRRVARSHLPEHFVDSFLNRNAVNRDLLQLGARLSNRC